MLSSICGVVGATLLPRGPATARDLATPAPAPDFRTTLTAFLDTLIPADAASPSASEAGVTDRLMAEAGRDPTYARLIQVGCRWIDVQTGGEFAGAPEAARILVAEWMSKAALDTPPRRFFDLVRDHALALYYTVPASWRGSPFERPPQPIGYPEIGQ